MVSNWEPLELPENGSYMVVSLGPANNFTGKVLDSLEFGNVRLWCITPHWGEKALIIRIKVRLSKQCLKWFIGPNRDIKRATVSVTWSLKVKSYLTNRTQRWSVNGCLSDFTTLKCGVPQGTILGPLLFLIYIFDLPDCLSFSTPRMYADDTHITYAGSDLHLIQSSLSHELDTQTFQW